MKYQKINKSSHIFKKVFILLYNITNNENRMQNTNHIMCPV
jgi:hypothetical protein